MAAVNDNNTVASYKESIANLWGRVCCHPRVGQDPRHEDCINADPTAGNAPVLHGPTATALPTIYAPQQQARGGRGYRCRAQLTGGRGGGRYQAPTMAGQQSTTPPALFERFENWNYCPTHGGDIAIIHTSQTCHWSGPNHNCTVTRTNTHGGLPAGLHKMILPLVSGQAPPPQQQQRAPTQAMWPQPLPPAPYIAAMTMMHLTMPAAPYQQAIYHVGQQMGPQAMYHGGQPVGPPSPYGAVHAPPAPPQGTMMYPSYATYQQPPPF